MKELFPVLQDSGIRFEAIQDTAIVAFVQSVVFPNSLRAPSVLFRASHTGQCQLAGFVGSLEFRRKGNIYFGCLKPLLRSS